MRITISGPIGSGKTTVGKLLSSYLGIKFLSGGQIFRESARKMGLSLEDFGRLAESDPTLDKRQDKLQLDLLRKNEDVVFESRLAGWLAGTNGLKAIKIFIDAPLEVRAERVCRRESIRDDSGIEKMKARDESDRFRYSKYYGVDYSTWPGYDLRVDTSILTAEEVAKKILEFIHAE